MASNLGKLSIAITASTKGLERAASKTKSILSGLGRAATSMPGILGGVAAGAGAVQLLKIADAYTLASSRMKYFVDESTDATEAQKKLYEMSQQTGTSFIENSSALTKFMIASDQTGNSMEENIGLLKALNYSMQLAGTSSAEAASTMQQLGQALASGELMGEELRAIRENAPMVADAIANAMGVSVGELKKLGSEGELTAERVSDAILQMGAEIETNMEMVPETAEKGFNRIVNAAKEMYVRVIQETGFYDYILEKMQGLLGWIESNEDRFVGWAVTLKEYVTTELLPSIEQFAGDAWNALKGLIDAINWVIQSKDYWTGDGGNGFSEATNDLQGFLQGIAPGGGLTGSNSGGDSGGGATVNNYFNAPLTKSYIEDISVGQSRSTARN